MMTQQQLKQLGIAATAAVKHQRMVGAFDVPPDMRSASKSAQNEFWRHQQVALATQRVCSFKDMADLRKQGGADEYMVVMQHFQALAGPCWKGAALNTTVKLVEGADCDRVPGCEYLRDLHHWMAKAEFKPGYLHVILKQRFKGADIRTLRTWQLKQLHDTIVNRCRAKLGLGDAANRNKKARHGEAAPPNPPTSKSPSLPPPPPAAGSPPTPPPSRSRDYTLRPRGAESSVPRENIPF